MFRLFDQRSFLIVRKSNLISPIGVVQISQIYGEPKPVIGLMIKTDSYFYSSWLDRMTGVPLFIDKMAVFEIIAKLNS